MEAVAIVLDGEQKSALAAVRSLGRAGISVVAGSVRETGVALHSRYAKGAFTYPDPKQDRTAFIEVARREAARQYEKTGEQPVLFCFSDATHVSVAEQFTALANVVRFPLPPKEQFTIAFDKGKTAMLAAELGIAVVPALDIADRDSFTYPIVIKPTQSVSWQENGGTFGTAEFVFSAAEFAERFGAATEQVLIQKFVRGDEYGVEMVCERGEVLALFTHKRIRSLSPTGGAAVVKETAVSNELTKKMQTQSKQLVEGLKWTGPIMVEWKVGRETNMPHLMEINGRFWGSLPLAVAAGVDFPLTYYRLATEGGDAAKSSKNFSPRHVRTQHFFGDLGWLMRVWFDKTELRALLYPSRLWALWLFVIEPLCSRSDVFWLSDMRPAAVELFDIIKRKS